MSEKNSLANTPWKVVERHGYNWFVVVDSDERILAGSSCKQTALAIAALPSTLHELEYYKKTHPLISQKCVDQAIEIEQTKKELSQSRKALDTYIKLIS